MKFSSAMLKKVALRVGFIGGAGIFMALNTIPYLYSERIRKTEHYKQAIELLLSHTEAIKYLGEPIKEGRVNPTNRENFGTDGETAWVRVPIIGTKDTGKLFYDYTVNDQGNSLLTVELTLNKLKDYKLLIKRLE